MDFDNIKFIQRGGQVNEEVANRPTVELANLIRIMFGNKDGFATLDAKGKLSEDQLPLGLLDGITYEGMWDASTNTPKLVTPPDRRGKMYRVSKAGTFDGVAYKVGDAIISSPTKWEREPSVQAVNSVNGYTGDVTLTAKDIKDLGTLSTRGSNDAHFTKSGELAINTALIPATAKQLSSENLNDVVEDGYYYQRTNVAATFTRNYPVEVAGILKVYRISQTLASNGAGVKQVYHGSGHIGTWTRGSRDGKSWTEWAKVFDSSNQLDIGGTQSSAKTALGLNDVLYKGNGGVLGSGVTRVPDQRNGDSFLQVKNSQINLSATSDDSINYGAGLHLVNAVGTDTETHQWLIMGYTQPRVFYKQFRGKVDNNSKPTTVELHSTYNQISLGTTDESARKALKLGNSSTKDVGTKVGDVSLFAQSPIIVQPDSKMEDYVLNNVVYSAGKGIEDTPDFMKGAVKWVNIGDSNRWESQLVFSAYDNEMGMRSRKTAGGDFHNWSRVWHSDNQFDLGATYDTAKTALKLGSASNKNVTTSPIDWGKTNTLSHVGDFGVGEGLDLRRYKLNPTLPNGDFNQPASEFYGKGFFQGFISGASAGFPSLGSKYGILQVNAHYKDNSGGAGSANAIFYSANTISYKWNNGGAWSQVVDIHHTGNQISLGTTDATARAILKLGNSATRNVGTTANTVMAGDDSRVVNAITETKVDEKITEATTNLIPEAPKDGKQYVRKNGKWEQVIIEDNDSDRTVIRLPNITTASLTAPISIDVSKSGYYLLDITNNSFKGNLTFDVTGYNASRVQSVYIDINSLASLDYAIDFTNNNTEFPEGFSQVQKLTHIGRFRNITINISNDPRHVNKYRASVIDLR